MRKAFSTLLIVLGLAMILGAVAQVTSNLQEEKRAGELSHAALESLVAVIPSELPDNAWQNPEIYEDIAEDEIEYPDYILNPDMEMPEFTVDGVDYIGQLEIPDLELSLPVASETTGRLLQVAPCRYFGTVYRNDLVIGAHNYFCHFGSIGELSYGSPVYFTDMDGNVFSYQVADIEILQPGDVEELCSGEWPLTLYTCTIGGRTRITVRCELIESA